jgi:putative ABC transport system ATP-binding protein
VPVGQEAALMLCEMRGAVVAFGATTALDGVDLTVGEGETVALVGPSGAGKSTLLRCLAGLVAPQRGSVFFDGRDYAAMDDDARAAVRLREVGFIMQGGELVPELSLLENVELPLRLAEVRPRVARERALFMLDRLGIADEARRRAHEVSGGQAQRAAVARALVHSPRVVFADEPTGALDSTNGRAVMDALTGLVRSSGAALVMVTHDRGLAAELSRQIEVRDGRATESPRVPSASA